MLDEFSRWSEPGVLVMNKRDQVEIGVFFSKFEKIESAV